MTLLRMFVHAVSDTASQRCAWYAHALIVYARKALKSSHFANFFPEYNVCFTGTGLPVSAIIFNHDRKN